MTRALAAVSEISRIGWRQVAVPDNSPVPGRLQTVFPIPRRLIGMKAYHLGDIVRVVLGVLEPVPDSVNEPADDVRFKSRLGDRFGPATFLPPSPLPPHS